MIRCWTHLKVLSEIDKDTKVLCFGPATTKLPTFTTQMLPSSPHLGPHSCDLEKRGSWRKGATGSFQRIRIYTLSINIRIHTCLYVYIICIYFKLDRFLLHSLWPSCRSESLSSSNSLAIPSELPYIYVLLYNCITLHVSPFPSSRQSWAPKLLGQCQDAVGQIIKSLAFTKRTNARKVQGAVY